MSHTTAIGNIRFADTTALRTAVAKLQANGINCHLEENAAPRAYYNGQQGMGQADLVLRLPDACYDVGFYASDDPQTQGYEARTDFYGGSVANILGVNKDTEQAPLGKLYQSYATEAARIQAEREGYSVQEVNNADGTIRLIVNA